MTKDWASIIRRSAGNQANPDLVMNDEEIEALTAAFESFERGVTSDDPNLKRDLAMALSRAPR
ncbi:hypothetical protein N825_16260 [Skermanella stibiiresistens SB22]|uniref:Uncharacterized protein n=1 Tax=Skermanella stibiiresistens SB22 TaxID=1385369 RepID=W9GZC1_9PROT|nr:hypothetical protein [Skermanella stibiiresistens]EWY37956.1 hypothetical protein N825_16260 [Skermanella stibiiresistens SB22]